MLHEMKRLVLVVAIVGSACGHHSKLDDVERPVVSAVGSGSGSGGDGLVLQLSNGKAGAPGFDRAHLAPATKLADADVATLLARAAPITADATDKKAFALRPGTQPPPKTGAVVATAFPADPTTLLPPKAAATSELHVVRYMPEGTVPLAPELSITFDQPMVAVTSQDDAAATNPVKLTPTPKGRWRWLGTRTILFDPEIRFPQATTYAVEVPAGTRSATGAALAAATKFTFETPPIGIERSWPNGGPVRTDAPMFIGFDQKIDQAAVLARLKVTAAGGWSNDQVLAVHLLDAAAIAKDKELKAMVADQKLAELDGRWLAFATDKPMPADAAITVEVPLGTPSAEGPNLTKDTHRFTFRTFPPFAVEEAWCSYHNEHCRPQTTFDIRMNNAIDAAKFDPKRIGISPAIPNVRIYPQGNMLVIAGKKQPRTRYTVELPATFADKFDQTLGTAATRTFDVGDADTTFYGPSGMVVLDPSAKVPTLDFFTTNYTGLSVQLYKVAPSDWPAYVTYLSDRWNRDHPRLPPGQKAFDAIVPIKAGSNLLAENHLDLSAALGKSGLGHVIAVVSPSPWTETSPAPQLVSWVQSTRLGIDSHFDHMMNAFVTELATGKPVAGAEIVDAGKVVGTTDATGLAHYPIAGIQPVVIARKGDDSALDVTNAYRWWADEPTSTLAWYVIDDRQLYRPGETVTIKGWVRAIDNRLNGDVGLVGALVTRPIPYIAHDPQGHELAKGAVTLSPAGSFELAIPLPKTPSLGYASVQFTVPPDSLQALQAPAYTHQFRIEEFRRPEFEVTAHASQGPFVVGESGDVTVDAKYYAGGPLAGAPARWDASASQTSFTPPNRDGYAFGSWSPWWESSSGLDSYDGESFGGRYGGRYGGGNPPSSWSLTGKTDGSGAHTLHLDFVSVKPAVPMSVTTSVAVQDVNHQEWSASTTLIVHPATRYVGLKTARPFVDQGTPMDVSAIGVDLDGKLALGAQVTLVATRVDQVFDKGELRTREVEPQTCTLTMPAVAPTGTTDDGAQPCHFKTATGGTYNVLATILDPKGRANTTRLQYWVSGGDQIPAREVEEERVTLVPDKATYVPGNTAEILVRAPFFPAEGIVTWRRSGIVKLERITLDGPTKVITVPIVDAMTPNLEVRVDLVGSAARTDDHGVVVASLPKRPAFAAGTLNLRIPPRQRTLAVTATPAAAKVAPGETTSVAIEVRDASGKPVAGAEAAVIVVDESILALAGYSHPDPIASIYHPRRSGTADHHSREAVKLARPDADLHPDAKPSDPSSPPPPPELEDQEMAAPATVMALDEGKMGKAEEKAPGGNYRMRKEAVSDARNAGVLGGMNGTGGKPDQTPIAIRSNFDPLAAFAPTVTTDANGRATVEVKMPDNLTRYRVIAIVASGAHDFGKGESAVTARKPLMVRPSAPRFLNFGDTFQLPVVVQNQTDEAMTVELAVRSTNAAFTDGAGRAVSVPANDRVEVLFPAAAEMAGTARFQFVGVAGKSTDAAEVSLPVWTPATTEAFATYGVIDSGAAVQPIALPGKVVPQFGGLEVSTTSTNLGALTDALLYIVHYPYECSEQRSSRIMSIAALRDVLTAFDAPGLPSPAALASSNANDIARIAQMQNPDGGFDYWERGYPSVPYLSVYVTHALVLAKAKGYDVPPAMLDSAKHYLTNIESFYPSDYPVEIRHAISAYALATRKSMGDLDVVKAQRLLAEAGGPDKLGLEADGWLLEVFAKRPEAAAERAAIVRHAMNKVSETAGAANFTVGYTDGGYLLLASDRRVDAIMIEALIEEQPDSDLIPKLVTGLLAHRKAGRWESTQENTWVLVALDHYFQTYEKTTPSFTARVWLGSDFGGEHAFRGHTTETFQIAVAMADVITHDHANLTIAKDGPGRLYYRVGMTYAPASLSLAAADYGFVVTRTYEGVDDPKDVIRGTDGVWHVRRGARVRVKLAMMNENRRYHVALVDPLPAGFEPMNPALATTGPIPPAPVDKKAERYSWWYRTWYEHQNLRDDRVEAFTQLLWEGVHDYDYVARATTPGTFVVPPTKAEEMYMPETFGRAATERMVIE